MPRNPAWAYDELVLALDVYFRAPRARSDKGDPALAELSELLRSLPLHSARADPVRFRNTNSVYLKLQNFKAVDPNYPGVGMRAGAGERERDVWDRFAGHPEELVTAAGAIREAARELADGTDKFVAESDYDAGVIEGQLIVRLHRARERRRSGDKKRAVLRAVGHLACEACGFDFQLAYGELGTGFAECHHKLPLSEGMRRTRLADLAIVCANCHRMLHRRSPWLSIEELRELVREVQGSALPIGMLKKRSSSRVRPRMDDLKRKQLLAEGFQGFKTFSQLLSGGIGQVSDAPGIYVVLRESEDAPVFLAANPGGRFKGRDPSVDVKVLQGRWVDGAHVIYVGKADLLRRRLRQFADFGAAKPVGHWGGRYIWQLDASAGFVVAWRETPSVSPRKAELDFLARFQQAYGRPPLANIAS
jgi:5-methylcytosine-specific restriction protein A